MLAKKGAIVTGTDISIPNIEAAKKYAEKEGQQINFLLADLEKLPFDDSSFDVVVCSHVLEHVPDFDMGFKEIMRVSSEKTVVAIPTILNLCSFIQVGGGQYYLKRPKSFAAVFFGGLLTLSALLRFSVGVDEGYVGKKGVTHIFRFPSVMRKKIKKYNYTLVHQEASTLCIPFFPSLLPVSRFLDRYKKKFILRELGYGTTYVIKK
jgi:2-polyprenyl-3-methyl-5-hydroxy-6-metoxy-1,4-benzoquinol methylase